MPSARGYPHFPGSGISGAVLPHLVGVMTTSGRKWRGNEPVCCSRRSVESPLAVRSALDTASFARRHGHTGGVHGGYGALSRVFITSLIQSNGRDGRRSVPLLGPAPDPPP